MKPPVEIHQEPSGSGQHLYSQHLGSRGRRIFEFKANLVYRASSKTAKDTQRYAVVKKANQNRRRNTRENVKTFLLQKVASLLSHTHNCDWLICWLDFLRVWVISADRKAREGRVQRKRKRSQRAS